MSSKKREHEPGTRRGRVFSLALVALTVLVSVASPTAFSQEAAAPAGEAAAAAVEFDVYDPDGAKLMPRALSEEAREIDGLFWGIFWLTGVTFVVVEGLLILFLIKYRHREGKTKAIHSHGSHKMEYLWTGGTAIILLVLALVQSGTWATMKQNFPDYKDALLIRGFAEQFAWHFNYAGPDGKFEEAKPWQQNTTTPIGLGFFDHQKDVTKFNELVVPRGVPVVIQLHSLGKYVPPVEGDEDVEAKPYGWTHPVLHSLFIPVLRQKQDLVPYNPMRMWFQVDDTPEAEGVYELVCAELCGEGHSKMGATFRVVSEKEFNEEIGGGEEKKYDWRQAHPGDFPKVFHISEHPPAK